MSFLLHGYFFSEKLHAQAALNSIKVGINYQRFTQIPNKDQFPKNAIILGFEHQGKGQQSFISYFDYATKTIDSPLPAKKYSVASLEVGFRHYFNPSRKGAYIGLGLSENMYQYHQDSYSFHLGSFGSSFNVAAVHEKRYFIGAIIRGGVLLELTPKIIFQIEPSIGTWFDQTKNASYPAWIRTGVNAMIGYKF